MKQETLPGQNAKPRRVPRPFAVWLIAGALAAFQFFGPAQAGEKRYRFAIVPKTIDSEFFREVERGCKDAAQALGQVECVFAGPPTADARAQDRVIAGLVEQGIDGLAVSVINSAMLLPRSFALLRAHGIPVVTIDSDFDPATLGNIPDIRLAYVGSDNFELGWEMGMMARRFRPDGGRICILSGHAMAPNLMERMHGLRAALAGARERRNRDRQGPDHGWREDERCPMYSDDSPERSHKQLLQMLANFQMSPKKGDTIVVLGIWPQLQADNYRAGMRGYKSALDSKEVVVIVGDTVAQQIRLLSEGLATANVGQSPYRMGYEAIRLLRAYKTGSQHPIPRLLHTPIMRCVSGDTGACREPRTWPGKLPARALLEIKSTPMGK